MQTCAVLCICLVNFVSESNAKTVPLNMQVPIVADFRMTNLKEYIDNKISKELKKASVSSEYESKVEKLEDTLSSVRTKFKNMSKIQDTLAKRIYEINHTDTVKWMTDEMKNIKKLQEENIKNIGKILNYVNIDSSEIKDVIGQTFYLMFSPNINSAQILIASSANGICNLHNLGTYSVEKIALQDMSKIKTLARSNGKKFKLHCNVPVKLFVLTKNTRDPLIDSYIALPKEYLGTEYLISSYSQSTKINSGTYTGIISTHPNTKVEIYGKDKKKLFRNLTLDVGKSWSDYNNDKIDISGSYVKSSNPVAVFSNILCVRNDRECHPFSDMVIPMTYYSKVFYIPHFENFGKWTIRLYAKSTCSIKIFDKSRQHLSTITVKSDKRFVEVQARAMSSVVSSCPSMVQLYGHNITTSLSFMALVPGIDRYLSYYYFMVPTYTSSLYVMIKTVHIKEFRIDESSYSPKQYDTFVDPTNPYHKYSVYSVPVSAGRHVVKTINDAPFGLWIYGKGFAYPAGYGVKTK